MHYVHFNYLLVIFNFYSRIHTISFLQSKFQDFKQIATTFKDFVYITALEDNDLITFLDFNQMRGLQASVIEKDRRLQASNSNQSDISSLSFLSGWLDGMVVGHAAHRLHACVRGFLTCTCFSSMGSPYLGLLLALTFSSLLLFCGLTITFDGMLFVYMHPQ